MRPDTVYEIEVTNYYYAYIPFTGTIKVEPIEDNEMQEESIYSLKISSPDSVKVPIGNENYEIIPDIELLQLQNYNGTSQWVDVTESADYKIIWEARDLNTSEYTKIGEGNTYIIPMLDVYENWYKYTIQMGKQQFGPYQLVIEGYSYCSANGNSTYLEPSEGDILIDNDDLSCFSSCTCLPGDKTELLLDGSFELKQYLYDYRWCEVYLYDNSDFSLTYLWHRGNNVYLSKENKPTTCAVTMDEEAFTINPYYCLVTLYYKGKGIISKDVRCNPRKS